jgi:hypothetical protein
MVGLKKRTVATPSHHERASHEATGSLPFQSPVRLESEFDFSAELENTRAAESESGTGLIRRLAEAAVEISSESELVRGVEEIENLSGQFQLESLLDDVELLSEADLS